MNSLRDQPLKIAILSIRRVFCGAQPSEEIQLDNDSYSNYHSYRQTT